MSNISICINAILPAFLVILTGYVLKRIKFLDESFVNMATKLVFRVCLPVSLFKRVSTINFSGTDTMLKASLFSVIISVFFFGVVYIFTYIFIKDKKSTGTFVQGSVRSNFVILGYVVIENLFGDEGMKVAAVMTAGVIIVFNVCAVIVLSLSASSQKGNFKNNIKNVIKKICKNPLIISIFAAIPFSLVKFKFPYAVEKTFGYISAIGTPLALLGIGAFITFENIKKNFWPGFTASLLKTVIIPIIATGVAFLSGFRGYELGVLFILFAAPTAISSFIMAKEMDGNAYLAANIVVMATLLSIITLFFGSLIFMNLGFFNV